MRKKLILSVSTAIIIGGLGSTFFYKDARKNIKVSTNNQNNNFYLINNQNAIQYISILKKNKIINKKPIQGGSMKYINDLDSYVYIHSNGKINELILETSTGKSKVLLSNSNKTFFANYYGNYAYVNIGNKLIVVNLKTGIKKDVDIGNCVVYIQTDKAGNILYSKNDSLYIYDIKSGKRIEFAPSIDGRESFDTIAQNNKGFIFVNYDNQIKYFNDSTKRIETDKYSLIPDSLQKDNPVFSKFLFCSSERVIYSIDVKNKLYIVSKYVNKAPTILSDNTSSYIRTSGNYIFYKPMSKDSKIEKKVVKCINLKTNKIITVSNKNLDLSTIKSTTNGVFYVLSNGQYTIEPVNYKRGLGATCYNSNLYKIDLRKNTEKLIKNKVADFAVNGENVTTIELISDLTDEHLETNQAYNIYFNGKKIVSNATYCSNYKGTILYKTLQGNLYQMYDGEITKLNINASNYDFIINNTFENPDTVPQMDSSLSLNGYWKSVNSKGQVSYYNLQGSIIVKVTERKKRPISVYAYSKGGDGYGQKDNIFIQGLTGEKLKKYTMKKINADKYKIEGTTFTRDYALDFNNAMKLKLNMNTVNAIAQLVFMSNTYNKNISIVTINGDKYYKITGNIGKRKASYYINNIGEIYYYTKDASGNTIFALY